MSKVLFVVIAFAFSINTVQAAATNSHAEYLKKNRMDMEAQTELRIIEMLESQRLEEERGRLRKVEAMSFEVVAPTTTVYQQTQ